MKLLVYIIGALSMSLSVLGLLFKTMRWPGAAPLNTFGLGMLALFFIPLLSIYWYKKD